MRQVMPHRNNMCLHRNKRKIFLRRRGVIVGPVTILQHAARTRRPAHRNIRMRNNGLDVP
jgi:hypothetical protein